ncbi:hypothetical protein CTAYLR_004141 [Chrysophaeum taylorii]|uniref:AAA+ ATPase domain-containing protein n=1 Tax=Chrysophaeum taylorii TaxID=2483200 RepID=A0AAD7UL83_9STRA|nr:hypothetical protein CTAYLR_004141 [Chrysophaeum taylorii]
MSVYRVRYDSVEGRRRLGVMGDEVAQLVPAAVTTVLREGVESAHVDDAVVFMHGVGAVQEVAKLQAALRVDELVERKRAASVRFEGLEGRLEAPGDERDEERVREEVSRREALESRETELDESARAETRAFTERDGVERRALGAKDERARERLRHEDESDRARHAELLRLREESTAKQEESRRSTDAALAARRLEDDRELEVQRREAELARVQAEAEARARAERETEDVRLRAMRAQMAEDRRRILDAIALVAAALGRGASALLDDPKMLGTAVLAIIALIGGGFFSREAAKLARTLAEAYLGRPRLVRETSRRRLARARRWLRGGCGLCRACVFVGIASARRVVALRKAASWVAFYARLALAREPQKRTRLRDARAAAASAARAAAQLEIDAKRRIELERVRAEESRFLEGVVLPASLRDRTLRLAVANRNARANGAPFRHMLLHGPPGTGKTLVAKRLARGSGLEYAIMSGGDVGPLGADGVTALHALFRWARTSATGVLVFIDEAEAFLASRARAKLTEHMRNALNAFLYQTGSPSFSFLLVLATNRPRDLDEAVLDRVDETLHFDLPTRDQRASLVRLYYDAYVGNLATTATNAALARALLSLLALPTPLDIADDIDDEVLEAATNMTPGFSGREIEKLMVAVQSAAYGSGAKLDARLFLAIVNHKCKEHAHKSDGMTTAAPSATPFLLLDGDDDGYGGALSTDDKVRREHREVEIIAKMNPSDGFLAELQGRSTSSGGRTTFFRKKSAAMDHPE